MGKGVFEAIFGAGSAYHQILHLAVGLLLLAIGVLLIAWFLYDHLNGKRVRGRVAAVRVSGRVSGAPAPASGYPYVSEMYTAVYEYTAADGSTIRATDDTSSNRLGSKIPGTPVSLYVSRGDPEKVARAGLGRIVLGLAFGSFGFLFVRTAAHFALTSYSVAIAGCLLLYAAFLINRATRPEKLREAKAQFTARRDSRLREGSELTAAEIRERIAALRKATVFKPRAISAIAIGLLCLGAYLGHETAGLVLRGERAEGRVVSLESGYGSSGRGSHLTYYPIVAFLTPDGVRRQFRDSLGSNPPTLTPGDRVTVLYDPGQPQRAVVDRGIWNWAAPGGCLAAGVLLLGTVARHVRNRRRYAFDPSPALPGE
jgi:hypothetical protein